MLDALAAEERAQARISAALIGHFCDVFVPTGPATVPSPPAAEFSDRLVRNAKRIRTPLLWVANEDDDEEAPLPRVRALFDHIPIAKNKRLKLLPGKNGCMAVADAEASQAWLASRLDPSTEHHMTGISNDHVDH